MDTSFYKYGSQKIDADDCAAVLEALQRDELTGGSLVEQFEEELGSYFKNKNVVVCNSGTSALYIASKALSIGAGDVVIIPSQTFAATANAPHLLGAEVVFCDVDKNTGLITAELLSEAIEVAKTKFKNCRLKAVFVVHMNGQSAHMPSIAGVAKKWNMLVIEDACHAIGGSVSFDVNSSSKIGACAFSDAATFSFHPVKNLTTCEGGAISFADPESCRIGRKLRNHGIIRHDFGECAKPNVPFGSWTHKLEEPSLNFRIPDILCALGITQLQKLDGWISKRAKLVDYYRKNLNCERLVKHINQCDWCLPAWHLMPVLINFGDGKRMEKKVRLFQLLNEKKIFPQVHYQPLHLQNYWKNRYNSVRLTGSETYFHRVMSLPLHVGLEETDLCFIVSNFKKCLMEVTQ